MPAQNGAAADVPPTCASLPEPNTSHPVRPSALADTSGSPRPLALESIPGPVCQLGTAKSELTPPPPPHCSAGSPHAASRKYRPFVLRNTVVPPTQVTSGNDDR